MFALPAGSAVNLSADRSASLNRQDAELVALRMSSADWGTVLKPWIVAILGITTLFFLACMEFVLGSFGGRPFPEWVFTGVALLVCIPLFVRYRLKDLPIRLFLCSLVILVAAYYGKKGLAERKPFLQTLYTIEPGMTEAEVDRIMFSYIKLDGTQQLLPLAGSRASSGYSGTRLFRRPPQGPANDADRGIVHFLDGRVTSIDFSAD